MKRTGARWLLLLCLFTCYPLPAITSPYSYETAEALYQQGKFRQSASMARKIHTADAYSLAARSVLVEAIYIAAKENKITLLKQAIRDCEQALMLEPQHLYAHLQIALALGFIAEQKNYIAAYFNGYAKEGKHHLEQALAIAPENPWANGLYGMWHLQVVQRAKPLIARKLYGASHKAVLDYCNKAEKLTNDELQVVYGCAVSLYALDKKIYKIRCRKMLEFVVNHEPSNVADSYIIRQAKMNLKKLG